jgi:hypothetical protein
MKKELVELLFEIDYALKIQGSFYTVFKEFVFADSVSECRSKAETIREELELKNKQQIHIFIGD